MNWIKGRNRLPGLFTKVKWRNPDGGNIDLGERTPLEHHQRFGANIEWHEWLDESPDTCNVSAETKLKKIEGFTPGPWRECGKDRGGCSCGQVWSTPADFEVAVANRTTEDGEISKEQMMANATLIAYAPELYTYAHSLEQECERLREALKPLAGLDLTGVRGEIVYMRDKTQITVGDVKAARDILNPKT